MMDYRRDIDGLRAIAVSLVVIYHAFPSYLPGGFIGVDVFFVISGYLITGIIVRDLESGVFSFQDFYRRRIRRIFPALCAVLFAVMLIGWWTLFPDEYRTLGRHVVAGVFFVSNFAFQSEAGYFDTASDTKPLLHLWSLSVEEQFYLVVPLLVFILWRHVHASRRSLIFPIVGLLLASFAANIWMTMRETSWAFFMLPTRAWELLLGGLISVYGRSSIDRYPSYLFPLLGWVGAISLLVSSFVIDGERSFPGYWATLPVVSAAAMLSAGSRPNSFSNALSMKGMVFLGRISYPLYLWHFPLLVIPRLVLGRDLSATESVMAVLAALLFAFWTWRFIECPIRYGAQIRRPVWILVPLMLAIGMCGITIRATGGVVDRYPQSLHAVVGLSFDGRKIFRESYCLLRLDQDAEAFSNECRPALGAEGNGEWLLLGDSHAAHLYPGLSIVAQTFGTSIGQMTAGGCPPIPEKSVPFRKNCPAVNDEILKRIQARAPSVVVIAAHWGRYFGDGALDEAIEASLFAEVRALRAAGVSQVILVGALPDWPQPLPKLIQHEIRTADRPPERLKPNSRYTSIDASLANIAQRAGATFVPISSHLCDSSGCLALVPETKFVPIQYDRDHLTLEGSTFIARLIAGQFHERAAK